ncbi:MAG: hypothetical protein IJM30_09265 [Thermoguttaceae bacterium]|nr:hypothetical protein [Thermoguttaceae bacterium]
MPVVLNDQKNARDLNLFRRDAPEILDLENAARFLGVSSEVLSKNLDALDIPRKAIGRTLVFSRDALVEWVKSA